MLKVISFAALSMVLLGAIDDGCLPIIDERDTTPALPSSSLGAAVFCLHPPNTTAPTTVETRTITARLKSM